MAWKLRFPEELPAVIAFEILSERLQIILKFEWLILQVIEFNQVKINQRNIYRWLASLTRSVRPQNSVPSSFLIAVNAPLPSISTKP